MTDKPTAQDILAKLRERTASRDDVSSYTPTPPSEPEPTRYRPDGSECGYWGDCPHCGYNDGYINISRTHYLICVKHKWAKAFGANLLSSWRDETEEDWQRNADLIEDFTEEGTPE